MLCARYVASQVKQNGYFVAGLLAGLCGALLFPGAGPGSPAACDLLAVVPSVPSPAADSPHVAPLDPDPQPLPLHSHEGQAAPTRPRYYSAELGMREPLLCAVITSVGELAPGGRAHAINATLRPSLPAFKLFVSAADRAPPPAPDVVVFTDARRTLAPFHVLKYLADNHLDDYDQFALVEDAAHLDGRALLDLATEFGRRDTYAGEPAPGDPALCLLRTGAVLSNSVLRRVRGHLDWCVRNAYSPHHHENVGRCVRHATGLACRHTAMPAAPAPDAEAIHRAHLLRCRRRLEENVDRLRALREELASLLPRQPEGARFPLWPAGVRADAGLPPPAPADRHDHLRWTWFNETTVLLPDDRTDSAALTGAWADAVRDSLGAARALPGLGDARLKAGLWRWEPARALRMLLRLEDAAGGPRLVETARVLGPARLLPEPYQTEAAPLAVILVGTLRDARDRDQLRRALDAHAHADTHRTATLTLWLSCANESLLSDARAGWAAGVRLEVRGGGGGACGEHTEWGEGGEEAARGVRGDTLVLLTHAGLTYTGEYLARARMNTLRGRQWFRPMPLQVPALPRPGHADTRYLSTHARAWCAHADDVPRVLSAPAGTDSLRVLHAPEPALTLHVPAGCGAGGARGAGEEYCYLGARAALGAVVLRHRDDIR